jgi:hypothetical protein
MKPRTFLFNFKSRFASLVESGAKLQTVRAHRKDGKIPNAGDIAKLYTGLRTREARLLKEAKVFECFPVHFDLEKGQRAIISNGIRLHAGEMNSFARLDGFEHSTEMLDWFESTYQTNEFDGFCVRWHDRTADSAEVTRE